MNPILEIRNLHKSFGNYHALNGLNMEVPKGDIFGFLGSNGAGKSTTIRCILTLIKPDSGEILFNGLPVSEHRKHFLSKIGSIVEKPDFYLHVSAFANLEMSARMYGLSLPAKYILETLEKVGLSGKEKVKVKHFSQGMKQRLGIAQSLLHDPEIIILDEPTNGLDPNGIIDFRNIVRQLKNEHNKTLLISSHILSELELLVDSFIIIDKGKKVLQGNSAELLSDKGMMVRIETENAERLYHYLKQSRFRSELQIENRENLLVRTDRSLIPQLHKAIAESGEPVYGFTARKKLEDLFLSLTQSGSQHVAPY